MVAAFQIQILIVYVLSYGGNLASLLLLVFFLLGILLLRIFVIYVLCRFMAYGIHDVLDFLWIILTFKALQLLFRPHQLL